MDNDRLRNLLSQVKSHDIAAGDFTDDELRYCTDQGLTMGGIGVVTRSIEVTPGSLDPLPDPMNGQRPPVGLTAKGERILAALEPEKASE